MLASVLLALSARGQGLQAGLARQPQTLTSEQLDTVRKYAEQFLPDLDSTDSAKIKRARTSLLEPLEDTQVSGPFRIAYTRVLEPRLSQLVADKREVVAINSLYITGELATDGGLAILQKQISSPDAVVRYAAVRGIGLTLEAAERTSPAVSADGVEKQVVPTLGQRLATEPDGRVADALARALVAAMNISNRDFATARVRAVEGLCAGLGARLQATRDKGLDPVLLESALLAGAHLRDALNAGAGLPRLPDDARVKVAGFAGDMLAAVSHAIKGPLSPIGSDDDGATKAAKAQARLLPAQIAALAESIVGLAASDAYRAQRLGDMLKSATPPDDARFLEGSAQIVGQGGVLTKAPFGLPADRFK